MKIVIVGGVAGGASAAARARRLSEDAEIILIERGAEPSFANCGLPYYVGGVIAERKKLLVAPAERLRQRYNLDVRTRTDVTSINREAQTVSLKDLNTGEVSEESWDRLILSTGAAPFRPPIPGIDGPLVLSLRDLADADRMFAQVSSGSGPVAVIGGGFIGIEVAENLVHRGREVTLVELGDAILPPWDPEMIRPLESLLREKGVTLRCGDAAERFEHSENGNTVRVRLKSGIEQDFDFAVVCVGVRPESRLAKEADLETGVCDAVVTNPHMQTSDPRIYAVGDVAQVTDVINGKPVQVPLAGPANRQGRIAADHIFGRQSTYRGIQGTAVVGLFGSAAAMTGHNEKRLRKSGTDFRRIYIRPNDHAGYYPGASQMVLKLLFEPDSGRILGAQAVGGGGVDKRIDVIATAIQGGLTVFDLEESELCYAPQFGSAKDPVNMAGFVASGVLRGDHPIIHFDEEISADDLVLDVRTQKEFLAGHLPDAVNIPIEELRGRLDELPTSGRIVVYCQVGQRGYMASRILMQRGFSVVNLSGGYATWRQAGGEGNSR